MKKEFRFAGALVAALVAGGLMAVPMARADKTLLNAEDVTPLADQGCEDRVTGGGFILPVVGDTVHANFGAGGGLHHGELWGHLNYVDHDTLAPVRHVKSKTVVAYCVGCGDPDCRRITYSPATVDGVEVDRVIIQVCDNGEPGVEDSFSICIPSLGYCRGGILGGDDVPSGGNIQLHAKDPGCGGTIPLCVTLVECPCFPVCP